MLYKLTIGSQILGFTLLLFLSFPPLSVAEIYKWEDDEGNIHYSEVAPPGIEAEIISEPGKVNSARALQRLREQKNQINEIDKQRQIKSQERKKKSEYIAAKEQNCVVSRERYEKLVNTRRIRSVDEEGNVTRATEEEHQARIQAAQANIDKWCN